MDVNSMMNGYDSKLFDALAQSSNRTFFFASNMKENTARWSKGAVEYFGLKSEILYPADIEWLNLIHPDDKAAYLKDFEDMANHVSAYHDVEYRIRNAEGEYVWVNCKGYMTYDDEGAMDFFAGFVTNLGAGGTVRLYSYSGDVDADLAAARAAVLEDPVGAYAVRTLSYRSTRILAYYEVDLTISYTHTAREVDAIPEVTGLAGVRQELARLVSEQRDSAIFLASYFSGDAELVEQLLNLACFKAPALFRHHDINVKTISLYPEAGTRRVVEIELGWSQDMDAVAAEEKEYAQQLEAAAAALLEANPPAGESYTVEELAAIVRAAGGGPDYHGTQLALYALSGEPASDFGLLMAMEYLCQQCGIEVEVVNGSSGLWLIVATPDGYRHLLPDSLYGPEEEPGEEPAEPFRLYTDQELLELEEGYEWDMALYPPCVEGGIETYADAGWPAE